MFLAFPPIADILGRRFRFEETASGSAVPYPHYANWVSGPPLPELHGDFRRSVVMEQWLALLPTDKVLLETLSVTGLTPFI
jgi:hypothetical protein